MEDYSFRWLPVTSEDVERRYQAIRRAHETIDDPASSFVMIHLAEGFLRALGLFK